MNIPSHLKKFVGSGMTSQRARDRLVERLRQQGIRSEPVLEAIRFTPRHVFVDEAIASHAYDNTALPIGFNQTISQPYIVARMTELLLRHGIPETVLEIGTGCGYQTAILAQLVPQVYSVERIQPLLQSTEQRLEELGLRNIQLQYSDGQWGWETHAPYQGILVTAAPNEIPYALLDQLAVGGSLILPLGDQYQTQTLTLIQRDEQGIHQQALDAVSFVPLCNGTQ
ncbi:protein-L-isoaspartate(D-aspartate) O-methyltransferase [Candidatus Venteria ishoeyi]|uniref:Protein-L-isoaspartate O-methyltransferase n=1 Tax=Candidatus Venteria ishoeyi TaxID=1899563 RepID=A0A1H6FGL7_9GAMM|nr:protein-L-isoaspartate(D-aspartate) O-methyltransferase [Candidatus Venteria ishoeyi]MDM8545232.1 protein-L-isoaspartate(D-aspartate) O-methyltransferase [Candidatus Venteria ishoeyi]SEH08144.1 Protein-L-isoaspartate O-methyltransferase [Candidatus Venteria ishoeyi]